MTPDLAELQHFVRDTLGCGCPDKVLEWIECSVTDAAPAHDIRLFRMDVGGRLLVYVIESGDECCTVAVGNAGEKVSVRFVCFDRINRIHRIADASD